MQTLTIMIEYNSSKKPCKITVPVTSQRQVIRYQRAILGILSKVELDPTTMKASFKEDLKAVYELLSHFGVHKGNVGKLAKTRSVRLNK